MQDHTIQPTIKIALHLTHEIRGAKSIGLPMLGHQIADINDLRLGRADGLGHAIHQQIGQDAGIEIARAKHDHIGPADDVNRLITWLGRFLKKDATNRRQVAKILHPTCIDIRLATDDRLVL